ncbi:unnamed protein product [Thelazia callipaeda]|uniref:rRNA methyltransferase 2, mitochondrial n=1 Tax=Thelazia callipaeda TaxID=103827 RepID=A0A0N5D0R8_THECL|nr:unnamed protein product [Thelazia callipaeda]
MINGKLENATPTVYARKPRDRKLSDSIFDPNVIEAIDAGEIFDYIKDINDPEHPLTLEQLNVVQEELITVEQNDEETVVTVTYVPTIPHCSMAMLIGLAIRIKLLRSLHPSVKTVVQISVGSHVSESAINKQLADKERVAAALENSDLLKAILEFRRLMVSSSFTVMCWNDYRVAMVLRIICKTIAIISVRCYSGGKKASATLKYLQRQWSDEFSRKAREHSYRARSAYKLLEINQRYKIIKSGMVVVDVGAAPGSWCQVAADIVQPSVHSDAFILGIDVQPVAPLSGVNFLDLSDITAPKTHQRIKELLNGRLVDVVISDMAPNPTGDKRTDHERILSLCGTVLELVVEKPVIPLVRNGAFLCKIWNGPRREEFTAYLKRYFKEVHTVKPKASRDNSSEVFLLAMKKLS